MYIAPVLYKDYWNTEGDFVLLETRGDRAKFIQVQKLIGCIYINHGTAFWDSVKCFVKKEI
jgi:hypothetical protein